MIFQHRAMAFFVGRVIACGITSNLLMSKIVQSHMVFKIVVNDRLRRIYYKGYVSK